MTHTQRQTLDNSKPLRRLINSPEWAADNLGVLERQYYIIARGLPGIDEAVAIEYLHEEDSR